MKLDNKRKIIPELLVKKCNELIKRVETLEADYSMLTADLRNEISRIDKLEHEVGVSNEL